MADALKAEGNKLFTEKKFAEAIEKFSQAIEIEPANHVLYSNRSGAYASMKDYESALQDSVKTTELKPEWSKGWSRKGAAQHGLGDLVGAIDAYDEALKLDASNTQAKSGRESVQRAVEAEARADGLSGDPSGGLGEIFNDPQMYQKLANNPKTSHLLADRQFMEKLSKIKDNPNAMGEELKDPRFMQVLGVLLGIDMQFGGPGDAAAAAAAGGSAGGVEEDVPMPDARSPPSSRPPPEQKKAPEPEPEDEEAQAAKKAKAEADEEKRLGTENYKKRQFDEAIAHYEKAWEIHKDITYLTNLGAAKFEKGDYPGAIEACEKAIAEGREVLADFKLIAKAFGRIGSAHEKMGDLPNAIEYYQRSLTEHRTPEILAKLRAAEKAKMSAEKEAYVSPEEAEKAREAGNEKFKNGEWAAAVEAYSEMIKRAPTDPRGYSNRAACFIKLMNFPGAVHDCDEALKIDVDFIRAYLRKAQAYFAMREYSKCIEVCTEAHDRDKDGKNKREIDAQQGKALEAQLSSQENETEEETMQRIQRDPEIVTILQDPVMQSILQQARSDPMSLQNHMQNADVRGKIQKLMLAGVIKLK